MGPLPLKVWGAILCLHRRLAAVGSGFRQLLDECRYAFAQQSPDNSALEIGRIAESLGYAAPGAFTRAFQRWSGTTPAAWRARAQSRATDRSPESLPPARRGRGRPGNG